MYIYIYVRVRNPFAANPFPETKFCLANYLTISSNSSNWSNTLQYRCNTLTQAHFMPGQGARLRSRPSSSGHLPIARPRFSSAPDMVGKRFLRSSIGFLLLRGAASTPPPGINPRLISAPDRVGYLSRRSNDAAFLYKSFSGTEGHLARIIVESRDWGGLTGRFLGSGILTLIPWGSAPGDGTQDTLTSILGPSWLLVGPFGLILDPELESNVGVV